MTFRMRFPETQYVDELLVQQSDQNTDELSYVRTHDSFSSSKQEPVHTPYKKYQPNIDFPVSKDDEQELSVSISSRGPCGEKGLQGLAGENGLTGPTGLQGLAGENGLTGPTGLQGLVGENGLTGRKAVLWNGNIELSGSFVPVVVIPYDSNKNKLNNIDIVANGSGLVNVELRNRETIVGSIELELTEDQTVFSLNVFTEMENQHTILTVFASTAGENKMSIVAVELLM
jgi:hypothetical protein